MGNQWIKNYDIDKKPYLTGGQNSLWQIHNARKQKEEYSVFIFDKRSIHKQVKNEKEREMIYSTLRKEGEKLTAIRHPNILSVIESPAEDNKRLVCVTEKVIGTLNSIVQTDKLKSCSIMDVKLIMLQIIEGLSFLHNDAKIVHLNLSPDNIYVTAQGKIKIGGFIFSQSNPMGNAINVDVDLVPKPYDKQLQLYPDLPYMAPEMALNPPLASYSSDIFSLGLILIGLMRFQQTGMKDLGLFQIQHITQYQSSFDCLLPFIQKSPFFSQVQDQIKELMMKMINKEMISRPNIMEIYHNEFFLDPLIRLMHSLKQFQQFEADQQIALLKQIQKNIFKFERQVIVKNLLPTIMPLVINEKLMSQVIFIAVDVSKIPDQSVQEKYQSLCWNQIKKVSGMASMPAQALYCLVQNIKQFYEIKIPEAEIQTHLIPLFVKCFESDITKLQDVALSQTQMVMEKIEYQYTKNKILPRLLQLCLDPTNKEVNLAALQVLSKTQHIFDKVSISENILPTLEKFRKITAPTKIQAQLLLEIYKSFLQHLNYEQIVTRLLPQLLPYIIELNIGKQLILKYSELLQNLIDKIAKERMACLPDDEEIEQEKKSSQSLIKQQSPSSQNQNITTTSGEYNWDALQPMQLQQSYSNNSIHSLPIIPQIQQGFPSQTPIPIQEGKSENQLSTNQIYQQNNFQPVNPNLAFGYPVPQLNVFPSQGEQLNVPFGQSPKQPANNVLQIDFNNAFSFNNQPTSKISKYKEFDQIDLLDDKPKPVQEQIQSPQLPQQIIQPDDPTVKDKSLNINVNYDPFQGWGQF